jgi:hypothetical protein
LGVSQNLDFVKSEVDALTSPKFSGRGYVNDGSNLAGYHLMARFRSLGLLPTKSGYTQSFSLSANTFSLPTVLSVDGNTLREGYDYIVDPASGSSDGTWAIYRLDSTNFQPGKKLPSGKGRIPVIDMNGIDSADEVSALFEFKRSILNTNPVILLQPDKLTWSIGQQSFPFSSLDILSAAFPAKAKEVNINVKPAQVNYEAFNVIGYIPGTRSDSSIVITAHYDHLGMMGGALFPGASDNGSGVSMMLDMARHFRQHKPEFDTYFIAFAGEEAGLVGSKFFVEHPMIPLPQIKLLVNLDLMGSAANGITVVNGKLYTEIVGTMSSINSDGNFVPRIKLRGKAANSDHYWFSEAGVPAIFIYTEGNVKAYHDVYDVASGLDWTGYESLFTLLVQFLNEI